MAIEISNMDDVIPTLSRVELTVPSSEENPMPATSTTPEFEKVHVGRYLVIGSGRDWRVMEQFGNFRMLKKKFITVAAAKKRAEAMDATDSR